jgi:phosphomannomutase
MSDDAALNRLVQQWLEWDTDSVTRSQVERLVAANDNAALRKLMQPRIAFGTAGLRGRMEAGFASMNALTVTQASQGFATYLLGASGADSVAQRGVVIGYDGRHQSLHFARLAAATFVHKGVPVRLFTDVVATPLVPFAVLRFGAAAGLMVTASHNPKEDNGYKVYWANGCQIVSPIDKGIAAAIEANQVPWPLDVAALLASPLVSDPTAEIAGAYKQALAERTAHQAANAAASAKHPIVFTAMHGVGKRWVADAFAAFGIAPYVPVAEQIDPNPDFPTVAFPNPEEGAGALRLAFLTAEKHQARLVLANDPDSDRLAVAERRQSYGELAPLVGKPDADVMAAWRVFTGNEIGIVLGAYCWNDLVAREPGVDRSKVAVINSTVSSKMLKAFAEKEGLRYEETLTGFKWIGTAAIRWMTENGGRFLFGFEEAIGFLVGDLCFDKDGVRSAATFAEHALALYESGSSVAKQLAALGDKYGHFLQRNGYYFCYDPAVMERIFTKLRKDGQYAKAIGSYAVAHVRDLTTGFDSQQPNNKAILPVSTSSHMITYYFANGAVATLRGSGTEPKLKFYIEMSHADAATSRRILDDLGQQLCEQLLEPAANGLVPQSS